MKRYTLELARLIIEDNENPHGGAICGDGDAARRFTERLNARLVIDGLLREADREPERVLRLIEARERGGVL